VIIAFFYGDPSQVQPMWLLLVLAGILVSIGLRKLRCNNWFAYVALGGSLCWIGLINAALHPALALVFVVPCMPDKVLSRPGCCGGSKRGADESTTTAQPVSGTSAHGGEAGSSVHAPSECGSEIGHPVAHDHHAALHAFEHHMKLPIDIGMFFFTLANAGVRFEFVGPLTVAIALSLVAGKIIGVTVLVLLADKVKCAPMNGRIGKPELSMLSAMASIGLTVALFISGEAFKGHERLQAESKMGALLSGLMGVVCVGLAGLPCWQNRHRKKLSPASVGISPTSVGIANAQHSGVEIAGGGGRYPGVSINSSINSSQQSSDNHSSGESEYDDDDDVAHIVLSNLERSMLLAKAADKERRMSKDLSKRYASLGAATRENARHVSAVLPACLSGKDEAAATHV